jgi:hypothetical protein
MQMTGARLDRRTLDETGIRERPRLVTILLSGVLARSGPEPG